MRIHLTGKLATQYGKKPIEIDAPNMALAMQCLVNMFGPRFKQTIREGEWHLTRNKKLKDCTRPEDTYSQEELKFSFGSITDVWLCPKVKAHKAIFRVIIGIILIVAAFYVGISTPWGIKLASMGASLVLGGIAEMLAPKPSMDNTAQEQPSFMFNGTMNTNDSGVAVPIVYGRRVHRASSIVLSAGMTSDNLLTRVVTRRILGIPILEYMDENEAREKGLVP